VKDDSAGHKLVVIYGPINLVVATRAFTCTLPVALRLATPGRPADVIIAERGGQRRGGRRRPEPLPRHARPILDGVKLARDAATKRISRLEFQLHHSGFAPTHVSATSIEV
jgi:hypothetical protein